MFNIMYKFEDLYYMHYVCFKDDVLRVREEMVC